MTTQNKRKDDELEIWAIVGGIFTVFLLVIDFFYSSVNQMALIARICIWIGHALVSGGWIISFAKWKDPAFDDVRKVVVYLCIVLSIIIGIHHATVREDKQVIEDSEKNKTGSVIKSELKSKGWTKEEKYEMIDRLGSVPETKKKPKVIVVHYGTNG